MTDAAAPMPDARALRRLVSFRVDARLFAVEVAHVLEIKSWRPATPIPHAPRHVLGVINLRGAILAVHDLRARIGLGLTRATDTHVILVLEAGSRRAGLLVDAVCDIMDVPAEALAAVPDMAAGDPLCAALVTVGETMVALLALERVLDPAARPGVLPLPAEMVR